MILRNVIKELNVEKNILNYLIENAIKNVQEIQMICKVLLIFVNANIIGM